MSIAENKNRIILKRSLYKQFSVLSREWHPAKNGDLTPLDVMPKSNKLVWWQCGYGHEWQARIDKR